MKFIHLSDLHLGKRVNEYSMLEDQEYILKKIINIVDAEKPDGVIIAGDVYDKSVPAAEAVQLFDNFLVQLAKRKLEVFVISGNHDSPERIAFGSRIMDASGIHMSPVYNGKIVPFSMQDEYGTVDVYMLPFIKPAHVRRFCDDEITTYTDAINKFCIMRNGKPAYNLSEGECSLISFCYFMAKLDDVATSGQKPIIWIDDPISSLDSNHIYFIFSLIVSKIAKTGCFSQLFISTHNLDFLKYLNRLKSYHLDKNGKQAADSKAYFLIERIGNHSSIQALPQYLKSNATEYNYLFSQIYKVSQCVAVTDDNYDILYSFGNSARKFLEMYLYFKYPTDEELLPKLKRFFEPEDVPPILINRLVNEDSHGPTPENSLRAGIDPETIPVAKKILQLLQKDSEQYDAFMESIS